MDHMDIRKAALVGVSMGVGTAIDFTLTYPGRVTSLVVVSPGLGGYPYNEDGALTAARAEINAVEETGDRDGAIEFVVRLWVDGPDRTPDQVDAGVRRRMTEMLNVAWTRVKRRARRRN